MESEKRLRQALEHIRRIKASEYPAVIGRPGNYRVEERPWTALGEANKLAILEEAVDWSGISNRNKAHILLAEIDPGKLCSALRNRLIDMAALPTLGEILAMKTDAKEWMNRDNDRGEDIGR